MPLTVADVLDLPVLAAGGPRVRVGGDGLAAPVRWVHVSEQTEVTGTLGGGELLLSTGMGLTDPRFDADRYLASLAEAGAVGLVVELGQHVAALPDHLVRAARTARFPLVELARAVRFVAVTEQVHARILHEQYERLQFSERVHSTFASLGVSRAEVGEVLTRAAGLLGRPLVLEDLSHHAVGVAGDLRGGSAGADVLQDWPARSRRVPHGSATAAGGPEGWVSTPVGPVGHRWGRLVLPERADPAEVSLVLERAAETLTVVRLLDPASGDPAHSLVQRAHDDLLRDLLRGRSADERELRTRARAVGLAVRGSFAAGVVLAPVLAPAGTPAGALHGAPAETVLASTTAALTAARVSGIAASLGPRMVGVLLSGPADRLESDALPRLARSLPAGATLGAAGVVARLSEVGEALAEARHVAEVASRLPQRVPATVHRTGDLGVRGLLWWLREDPRLQSFVETQLAPLLRPPGEAQALDLLREHLAAGGSMTRLASRLQLSRPAAYGRVQRLRERLGRDLDDPEERLALHLALLARELRGD